MTPLNGVLGEILKDLGRVNDLAPAEIPGLLTELADHQAMYATVQALLVARLAAAVNGSTGPAEDRVLDVEAASKRLGVSVDWLRRQGAKLPFIVRMGASVGYSSVKIDRWIAAGGDEKCRRAAPGGNAVPRGAGSRRRGRQGS